MSHLLHWGDVLMAVSIFLFFSIGYATGRISRKTFSLFWVGALLGAVWEFGFFLVGPEFSSTPAFTRTTPWPLPAFMQPLLHTMWDGALFMMGVWLVRKLLAPPHFTGFRPSELLVLLLWGQLQELGVELMAVYGNLWTYEPTWWNPVLFRAGGGHFTLMPQLVWFVAPIVFYFIAVRVYGGKRHG